MPILSKLGLLVESSNTDTDPSPFSLQPVPALHVYDHGSNLLKVSTRKGVFPQLVFKHLNISECILRSAPVQQKNCFFFHFTPPIYQIDPSFISTQMTPLVELGVSKLKEAPKR